jgi:hypothetical protein
VAAFLECISQAAAHTPLNPQKPELLKLNCEISALRSMHDSQRNVVVRLQRDLRVIVEIHKALQA